MPAAIAVPAIIGAAGVGANLYGAKKASDASKDAAKLQIASTDKAQAVNERIYADQKALMDPYIKGGNESLARLMAKHWGTALPQGFSPTGGDSSMLSNAARLNTPGAMPYGPGPAPGPMVQPMMLGDLQNRARPMGGPGRPMPPPGAVPRSGPPMPFPGGRNNPNYPTYGFESPVPPPGAGAPPSPSGPPLAMMQDAPMSLAQLQRMRGY